MVFDVWSNMSFSLCLCVEWIDHMYICIVYFLFCRNLEPNLQNPPFILCTMCIFVYKYLYLWIFVVLIACFAERPFNPRLERYPAYLYYNAGFLIAQRPGFGARQFWRRCRGLVISSLQFCRNFYCVYLTNLFILFIYRFWLLECILWIGKVASVNRVLLDPY
jgi:hypothetical protein